MSRGKKRKYDPTEQLGIVAVQSILTDFGWIPRDKRVGDFGVDLDVETVLPDGKPSGRFIAIQVKSGGSFFKVGNKNDLHHYAEQEHIDYWAGYQSPVAIVFHNPDTKDTIWQWTNDAKSSGKRWRITVPRTRALSQAKDEWAIVAAQGMPLDPKIAARLEAEVEDAVAKADADNRKPEIVFSVPEVDQQVPPRVHTEMGYGALSAAALDQLSKLLDEKLRPHQPAAIEASSGSSTDPRRNSEDASLHAKIDQLREIKNEGDPRVAHRKFLELIPKIDRARTPFAYFRAKTNLAACALDLGMREDAIAGFEAAHHLEPESALAISNLGLARLLQGDHQAAFDLAQEALSRPSHPSHALTVLLSAAARLEWKGDPESLIPNGIKDTRDARFAVLEYLRVTQAPSWVEKAIAGYAEYSDDPAFRRLWAYAVLEAATTDRQFVPGGQSVVSPTEVSAAAIALKTEVENRLSSGYADKEDLANEATNAAIAFRVIDSFQPGIDLLRRVLAYTGHQPNATRILALLEALNGNESAAILALDTIPEDGEAQLLRAEMLGRTDPRTALKSVVALRDEIIPSHHKTSRWIVAANLAIKADDAGALAGALAQIRLDHGNAIYADLLDIGWRAKQGESSEALVGELATLADTLTPDVPFMVRVNVAQALKKHDAFIKASRVLDGYVNLTRDSDAARLYIELLASSGRDTDFHAAIAKLPTSALEDPDIVWIRTIHAFNRGDLDQAEKHSRHLGVLRPTFLKPTLLLLESLVRRRRDQAIKRVLRNPVETLKTESLSDQMRLARLLIGFGFPQRGLSFLYRLLLKNRDDARLWTTFGALVLDAGRKPGGRLEASVIGDDVAVILNFENGQRTEFIVEPTAELRKLDPEAREPTHPDVVAVLGLQEGDAFTLPDGRTGVVGELRHKFVARMQTVLQQFEERFPTIDGFKSIKVDVEAEGGLDAVKAMLKDRADFLKEEADSYEAGDLPLAIFAFRVGTTTIDAAGGLAQDGRKFQVAVGEDHERAQGNNSLTANARRGAVVDAQTFWTIWTLGVAEVVEATVGKLHYSANALFDLQARLERFSDDAEDGMQSMSYQDGQIALSTVSAEDAKAAADSLAMAIGWLEANAVLSPANMPANLPDETREALMDMGVPFLDEIFIAKEKDLLLLVDDLRLRRWAAGLGVERSCWLHWTLAYAVDEGIADLSSYATWSAKLLANGQSYLGLAPPVFFEALRQDIREGRAQPSIIFEMLATCLGGAKAELVSHTRVTAKIIHQLWSGNEFRVIRDAATSVLLRRLTTERYADHGLILAVLLRVFRTIPNLVDYVRGWAKGHFLKIAQDVARDNPHS